MKYTVESDIGLKRSINEDRAAFFRREDGVQLALVADGMGGHNAGDVASTMATVEARKLFYEAHAEHFETPSTKKAWLLQTVRKLNQALYQHAKENPDCSGMGTTLILVLVNESRCLIAHVGDSRVYHFSAGTGEQITKDHSYVNALIDSGEISEEEAVHHPTKNVILRALGTDPSVEPDIYSMTLTPTSFVLVCSDGLSNKLSIKEMATIIYDRQTTLQEKGQQLVKRANDGGGEDNISLVLLMKEGES